MRRDRRWCLLRPVSLALASVAVLGLVLALASNPHTHDPGRPGFYNQEHDLTSFATFKGSGLLPDTPSAAPVVVQLAAAAPVLAGPAPVVERRHADFRAPPLR